MAERGRDKVADLRRQMGEAGAVDPLASRAGEAAAVAAGVAQDYVGQLADAIRRQPFAALAIGMVAAYLLGRTVTLIRR